MSELTEWHMEKFALKHHSMAVGRHEPMFQLHRVLLRVIQSELCLWETEEWKSRWAQVCAAKVQGTPRSGTIHGKCLVPVQQSQDPNCALGRER